MSSSPSTDVLGDALVEAIAGRRVRTAVFTTFAFEPGFFEEHVLPLLFADRSFHPARKLRMVQLEDALGDLNGLAVYYDRTALSADEHGATLNAHRIDVRWRTGVFHPKLILVLVEEPDPDDEDAPPLQSLLVGALSANLTRHGWWEAVETAHFEEIEDKRRARAPAPFRADLLSVLRRLRKLGAPDEPHDALDRIHSFLRSSTLAGGPRQHSARGRYYTRLFYGQEDLSDWLRELHFRHREVNLEIVSPYFDKGRTAVIEALVEATEAVRTRVYLPHDELGEAAIDRQLYDDVVELPGVVWADLPESLVNRAGARWVGQAARRGVHAKVYRLWNRDGLDVVLTGSANCTTAGTSHVGAGNFEVAFLVDLALDGQSRAQWWLQPLEVEPTSFAPDPTAEEDDAREGAFEASVRFDWETGKAEFLLHDAVEAPVTIETLAGEVLYRLEDPPLGLWQPLSEAGSNAVQGLLGSTAYLRCCSGSAEWTLLVQEIGWAFRPSLLHALSPEEILLYWSLLTAAQKSAFLESRLATEGMLEGLPVGERTLYRDGDTFFDRFAGLFHAFGRLRESVIQALEDGLAQEATARLFGEKYDSLPVLLDRVAERDDGDSVMGYLTFLCARQLRDDLANEVPDFWHDQTVGVARLHERLRRLPAMRNKLLEEPTPENRDPVTPDFLQWYEAMFEADLAPPSELEEDTA